VPVIAGARILADAHGGPQLLGGRLVLADGSVEDVTRVALVQHAAALGVEGAHGVETLEMVRADPVRRFEVGAVEVLFEKRGWGMVSWGCCCGGGTKKGGGMERGEGDGRKVEGMDVRLWGFRLWGLGRGVRRESRGGGRGGMWGSLFEFEFGYGKRKCEEKLNGEEEGRRENLFSFSWSG